MENSYSKELDLAHRYLKSEEAFKTLETDPYWPKWNGPWWHMLLLHEMGLTSDIPESIVEAFVERVNRAPREDFCHCQIGNMYQVFSKRGVDVDTEWPWMRPWFLYYQMADGGLNCDTDAYLVKNEVPSSMVGFIAPFEAVLQYTNRPFTAEEKRFLDLGAQFLMKRELRLGSDTQHNNEETESAPLWMKTCFPRFYLYDVLRGLNALTLWAEKTGGSIPRTAIQTVTDHLKASFPDGQVKTLRHSYEGVRTRIKNAEGQWERGPAMFFPLLDKVSALGQASPWLTEQYSRSNQRLQANGVLK